LADKVTATDNSIIVDGKEIKIYAEKNAADLPWGEIGVERRSRMHGILLLQSEEPGAHRRRREESRYLRTRGQRPAHHRLQRQRKDFDRCRHHHFRGFVHDQLPRAHGEHAQ